MQQLAADLRDEFLGIGGFSASNLWEIKLFYEEMAFDPLATTTFQGLDSPNGFARMNLKENESRTVS